MQYGEQPASVRPLGSTPERHDHMNRGLIGEDGANYMRSIDEGLEIYGDEMIDGMCGHMKALSESKLQATRTKRTCPTASTTIQGHQFSLDASRPVYTPCSSCRALTMRTRRVA